MRRAAKSKKRALSKDDIINILNSCTNIRLKTYIMLLAATGMRAEETLTIRLKDIDFKSRRLTLRGDYTKTRVERTVLLTQEIIKQLETWLNYKYRVKRIQGYDKSTGKWFNKYEALKRDDNDLVFAVFKTMSKANSIYSQLCRDFEKTLDRMGMGSREESNKRRLITLHSFRRFVKSTISDLGYSDFSEYFIGHSGSIYYTKTDKQIREIFRKVEPHLTYLDYPTLEQKGADIQAKVEHLENENQRLRHSDQMKEDALATLSDQVMKLMVEVQELKKR